MTGAPNKQGPASDRHPKAVSGFTTFSNFAPRHLPEGLAMDEVQLRAEWGRASPRLFEVRAYLDAAGVSLGAIVRAGWIGSARCLAI